VIIRPVEERDVPALSALAARTWADAFGHTVSREEQAAEVEQTRSEKYFRAAMDSDTILVCEDGGELVGYAQFGDVGIAEADAEPGDQELRRVYVETRAPGPRPARVPAGVGTEHRCRRSLREPGLPRRREDAFHDRRRRSRRRPRDV
jgi:hypothetical protein